MKKTVVEYITDTLEDIPKQSLQTNKRRLHAFMGHRTKRILRIERKEYQTY